VKRLKVILIFVIIVLAGGAGALYFRRSKPEPTPNQAQSTLTEETASETQKPFDKSQYSLTDLDSPWLVANKNRPLPSTYKPSDLVTPAVTLNSKKTAEENTLRAAPATALKDLFGAAKDMGFDLMLASGFRSYSLQNTYYSSYVARDGQAAADRYSARPGTSEHQTGLSLDISRNDRTCYLEECFGETAEGKWLAENAYKYGFVLRYPNGKESSTGYQYEPWHFRYVGKALATELFKQRLTIEEFFAL
jgi:zinc D-Ala-D-Ala carboxypeptidase